jgi:hypothetical protein
VFVRFEGGCRKDAKAVAEVDDGGKDRGGSCGQGVPTCCFKMERLGVLAGTLE